MDMEGNAEGEMDREASNRTQVENAEVVRNHRSSVEIDCDRRGAGRMGSSGVIWGHLGSSEIIWDHLGSSGII